MGERSRRRSRDVALAAVPVLAIAFAGCGEETAYCVDQSDRIVENSHCDEDAVGLGNGAYFWYYGGSLGNGRAAPGTRLTGGDRVAASNIAENARRGGFGSSGRSNASGIGRVAAHSGGG